MTNLSLKAIGAVLGVSKTTASLLRNGRYPSPTKQRQYTALVELIAQHNDANAVCMQCPRDDCTGCRILEQRNEKD